MKPEHIAIAEQIARDASCAQGEFGQRVLSIIPYLTDVCDRAALTPSPSATVEGWQLVPKSFIEAADWLRNRWLNDGHDLGPQGRADFASATVEYDKTRAMLSAAPPPPAVQGEVSTADAIKISDALLAANVPYSGMSWGGFNLFGDDHSIREFRRLQHQAGLTDFFRQRYLAVLKSEETAFAALAAAPPAVMPGNAVIEFARWAIQEGSWSGLSLDGADIEEKARALGLIVETKYDPAVHGPNDVDADLGDPWFAFSDLLSLSPQGVDEDDGDRVNRLSGEEAPPSDGWREERERCARVADHYANNLPSEIARKIAAAIRALPSPPQAQEKE